MGLNDPPVHCKPCVLSYAGLTSFTLKCLPRFSYCNYLYKAMDFITAFSHTFISYWDYIHLPLSLLILPLLILVSLLPLFTFMVHPLYKTRYGRRPAIFVFLSLSSFAQHDDPQLHHILCVTSTILFFFTSYSYSTAYMHFFCSFTPMSTQANSTTYLR